LQYRKINNKNWILFSNNFTKASYATSFLASTRIYTNQLHEQAKGSTASKSTPSDSFSYCIVRNHARMYPLHATDLDFESRVLRFFILLNSDPPFPSLHCSFVWWGCKGCFHLENFDEVADLLFFLSQKDIKWFIFKTKTKFKIMIIHSR
jgi:hypothetical protein